MTISELNPGVILSRLLAQRWPVWVVNILLVGWLVWIAGTTIFDWRNPTSEAGVVAPAAVAPPHLVTEIPASQVAEWHLFGETIKPEAEEQPRILDAPETQLQLSLKGIVATDDNKLGYAIIQEPNKKEEYFRVGDSVFDLATLEEIYIDRVILLRNGKYETLRLPIEFMASDLFLERQRKKEAKRIVSDFRHKLISRDSMALIRLFGFDTAYRNGGFVGFRVKIMGEEGARMLKVLGVEEGDLITAVNGKVFSKSLDATQSLTKLKDAKEVDVDIDRNGVPLSFHFDFDEIERQAHEMEDDSEAEGYVEYDEEEMIELDASGKKRP